MRSSMRAKGNIRTREHLIVSKREPWGQESKENLRSMRDKHERTLGTLKSILIERAGTLRAYLLRAKENLRSMRSPQ
ncbi:hypothetical protein CEXT_420021 [Caerostris extrusa]|uniref:Uncharacterized protein n=1 Tax=Caerostris extrusa TaxID=172846 RepID=A0AAV4XDZ7_CAEEX|nr:hypothetical protein CEXT_420021 [Caerostris extrusa]